MKTKFILLLLLAASIFPIEALSNEVKKVAILDIVDREEKISYGIKLMLRSNLENAITNTPGYEGLDRVDVTSIINEQNFQRTGMVDDSQIKQLGEMTGADYILVAEGAMINSNEIFLTAKIINIESAHLERTANIQTTLSSSDLGKNCRSLAGNLFNINMEIGSVKGELMIGNDRYVGEYKNGKPHGKGIMYYAANDANKRKSYEGDWVEGKRQGKGKFYWVSGERYEGEVLNDKLHGFGIYYWADGHRYEGDWVEGKKQGKGKFYWADGCRYEGDWLNDKRHGFGTWSNGSRYEKGNYINGKPVGKHKKYNRSGEFLGTVDYGYTPND